MSRSGLVIAAAYVALSVICVVWGYSLPDPEESTVLMQLPVLPAVLVFGAFGAFDSLERLADTSLIVFYGLLTPAIAIALYGACWLFGALSFWIRMVIGLGLIGVLSSLLFWPVRR